MELVRTFQTDLRQIMAEIARVHNPSVYATCQMSWQDLIRIRSRALDCCRTLILPHTQYGNCTYHQIQDDTALRVLSRGNFISMFPSVLTSLPRTVHNASEGVCWGCLMQIIESLSPVTLSKSLIMKAKLNMLPPDIGFHIPTRHMGLDGESCSRADHRLYAHCLDYDSPQSDVQLFDNSESLDEMNTNSFGELLSFTDYCDRRGKKKGLKGSKKP